MAAGRDIVADLIITGDRNTVFAGGYQQLSEAFIDPWEIFERVRVDRFKGRADLTAQIDNFLDTHDNGYIILEAEAGVGKTTFLAHLARTRRWVCHFVELSRGDAGVVPGLRNLAAQLIRAYELGYSALPEAASVRPDFLSRLLKQASDRRAANEKIVVVVDSLDEAGRSTAGENPLDLPKVLPSGVFLLVSKRPVDVVLTIETPRMGLKIERDSGNLADIREFLKPLVADSALVNVLLDRCEGVWIYLDYVLRDVEHGSSKFTVEALPQGLWGYYAKFWREWKRDHLDSWHRQTLPLLATLAVAEEDLDLSALCAIADVEELSELPSQWRSFLTAREKPPRYRFYHRSLADFVSGKGEALLSDEQDFADELARATRVARERIPDRYVRAWGGMERGLPRLTDPSCRDTDGGYGLRHIAAHMVTAGRLTDLHALLHAEWRQDNVAGSAAVENVWFTVGDAVSVSGYLTDVGTAWAAAEVSSTGEIERDRLVGTVALELSCALMSSSARNVSRNLPAPLLAALVSTGLWTEERALGQARIVADPGQRARSLALLAGLIAPPRRDAVIGEAVRSACAVEDEMLKPSVIGELPSLLPGEGPCEALVQALPRIRQMAFALPRTKVLISVAARLPENERMNVLREVVSAILTFPDSTQDALLPPLLPQLPPPTLVETWRMVSNRPPSDVRSLLLVSVAIALPEGPRRVAALRAALRSLTDISHQGSRVQALEKLAPHLPPTLLDEAIETARGIGIQLWRLQAIAALAPYVPQPERERQIKRANEIASDITRGLAHDEVRCAEAQAALAPATGTKGWRNALAAALALGKGPLRSKAVIAVAAHLPSDERAQALRNAVADATYRASYGLVADLLDLIRALPPTDWQGAEVDALRSELLALDLRGLRDPKDEAKVAAALAAQLPEPGRSVAVRRTLDLVPRIEYEGWRTEILVAIAPLLTPEMAAEVLALVSALDDGAFRGKVIASLAPQLAREPLQRLHHEARAIRDADYECLALAGLASRLPEPERTKILHKAVQALTRASPEVAAIGILQLARSLPPALLGDAIPASSGQLSVVIDAPFPLVIRRGELLRVLAENPAAGNWRLSLRAALSELVKTERSAENLSNLAAFLPAQQRTALLQEALAVARAMPETVWPIGDPDMFGGRGHYPPGGGRSVDVAPSRAVALLTAARHLSETDRTEALTESLATAIRIEDDWKRVYVLTQLAAELAQPERDVAIAKARETAQGALSAGEALWLGESDAEGFSALLSQLTASERQSLAERVVSVLTPLPDEDRRIREQLAGSNARTLAVVSSYLPTASRLDALGQAVDAISELESWGERTLVLARLCAPLLTLDRRALVPLWRALLHRAAWRARGDLLCDVFALAPVIDHLGGADAIRESIEGIRASVAWWP